MHLLRPTIAALLATASTALAAGVLPSQIKNLVTFGDSYTDVAAANAVNGTAWPVFAAEESNTTLFPFARSGATCSNNLTFRDFPSVFESQLPLYFTEKSNGSLELDSNSTIYTLWIGTNDLGAGALLTGDDKASLVNVTTCMVNWVQALYDSGARDFIFQNMIPLQHVILYSPDSYPNRYWDVQRNTTEWNVFMTELVLAGNELTKLKLQNLASTLKDAHIALFDSHSLFQDMIDNPSLYLNGTAPLNTTGAIYSCVFQLNEPTTDTGDCTIVPAGPERDSFLWFDELHPSEQANRVVGREIAKVIQGDENKWTTWLS